MIAGTALLLRRVLLALLVLAAAGFASTYARAQCDSDLVMVVYLEEVGPGPAQSQPCCAPSLRCIAAGKQRPGASPIAAVAAARDANFPPAGGLALPASMSPVIPWRPYCARSSRLLR